VFYNYFIFIFIFLLKKLKMIFFQKNKLKNFGNFGAAKTTPNGFGGGQNHPLKSQPSPSRRGVAPHP
jgi:hypothetical protein